MLHRIKKAVDENSGKWIGVGGKFEQGESPEECAKREIFEETGLVANKLNYRGIVTFVSNEWGTEYMHLFTCTDFTGTLKECDEGVLKWYPKDKINYLNAWEGDKIFLDLIAKNSPFFSLKLVYHDDKLMSAILNQKTII